MKIPNLKPPLLLGLQISDQLSHEILEYPFTPTYMNLFLLLTIIFTPHILN